MQTTFVVSVDKLIKWFREAQIGKAPPWLQTVLFMLGRVSSQQLEISVRVVDKPKEASNG